MSQKIFKLAIIVAFFSLLLVPATSYAQFSINDLGSFAEATSLPTADIRATVARLINGAMGLLGIIAVIIILVGGFKWMTAMGNEDNVKKAKTMIIQGVIGLIIVVCSYALAQFILNAIDFAVTGG